MNPALFLALSVIGTPVQASPTDEAERFVEAMIGASLDYCRHQSLGVEGDLYHECVEKQQNDFRLLQESVSAVDGIKPNVADVFVDCVQSNVIVNVGLDMHAVRVCFEREMNLTGI